MIVSDAGPIIIFARIRLLSLLHQVTGSLIIPDAVHHEIVVNKGGMPGATASCEDRLDSTSAGRGPPAIDELPRALHQGEREAIALGQGARRTVAH